MNYEAYHLVDELLGRPGRMLSGSKTAPAEKRVVWNANVIAGDEKIWYGDISITDSEENLQELANKLGEKIYVLREMDARFENEKKPRLDQAVATFEPEK